MGVGDKPSDVLFLLGNPAEFELKMGKPFQGSGNQVVSKAISSIAKFGERYRNFTRYYAYSTRCGSQKIDIPSLKKCSPQVLQEIHSVRPRVIVPMGNDALKTLGVKARSIRAVAGKELTMSINGVQYRVLPTMHPYSVFKESGLFNTFREDIKRAVDYAYRPFTDEAKAVKLAELTAEYSIPSTQEEAATVLEEILAYTGPNGGDPDKWLISVDVETNTLLPHSPTAKVIMISFAWDEGKSTAIVLDHKDATYDWKPLRPLLVKILSSKKPKTFHNGKFDIKFIENVLGIEVNGTTWDSMLGEHLLDEAKRGYYGLKSLTIYYTPDFIGYEDKVKEYLNTSTENLNSEDAIVEETDPDVVPDEPEITEVELKEELLNSALVILDEGEDAEAPADLTERLDFYKQKGAPWRKRRGALRRRVTAGTLTPAQSVELATLSRDIALSEGMMSKTKEAIKAAKAKARLERKKGVNKTFEDIPLQTLLIYAAVDSDITRRITKAQVKRFNKGLYNVMQTYAIPGTKVLGDMEMTGFRIDSKYLAELEVEFTKLKAKYQEQVYEIAGKEFNINSVKDLPNVLYMDFGLPVLAVSDKTGKPKADKATLNALIVHPDSDDEAKGLCRAVLNFRECSKALNGFLRGHTGIHELSQLDGKIHTQFNINGTSTGRLSSARKNLQNIPKKMHGINIKKLFITDSDEEVVVNMDYSGAELRVLSAYAPDPDLIKVLRNPEEDIHSLFTHRISAATAKKDEDIIPYRDIILVRMHEGEAAERLSKEEYAHRASIMHKLPEYEEARRRTKRVVFGTLYGMTKVRLSKDLDISEPEAQDIIDGLMRAFPAIENYITETKREVQKQGWVETNMGRRRRFPLRGLRGMFNAAIREAVNFKIQSTASDIVFGQLVEIADNIHLIGGTVRITVHDSIVFTMPKSRLPELKPFLDKWALNRINERYPWLPVPMRYDVEVGSNYGETTELETYLKENGL